MTEPTVSYPIREVLARIERDIVALRSDLQAIQLSLASSSATGIAEDAAAALRRAKVATWTAAGSPLVSGLLAWAITRK
jgi:hypothetical protein